MPNEINQARDFIFRGGDVLVVYKDGLIGALPEQDRDNNALVFVQGEAR